MRTVSPSLMCCLLFALSSCGQDEGPGAAAAFSQPALPPDAKSDTRDAGTGVRDAGAAFRDAGTQITQPDAGSPPPPALVSSIVIDPATRTSSKFFGFDLKTDASGTLHAAYAPGGRPRYGRCATDCTRPSSWAWLSLNESIPASGLHLAVSRGGRVYLAWTSLGADFAVRYAACRYGNCLAPSGWTITTLLSSSTAGMAEGGHSLAVDATGVIHMIANASVYDRWYLTCSANCDAAGSWSVARLGAACERSSIAVGTNSVGVVCSDSGVLKYSHCSSLTACASDTSWRTVQLSNNSYREVALEFQGNAPRVAHGVSGGRNIWSCESGCETLANWSGIAWRSSTSNPAMSFNTGNPVVAWGGAGEVEVLACSAGSACWIPGSSWLNFGSVDDEAQSAATVSPKPQNCPNGYPPFAIRDLLSGTAVVADSRGAFVLTSVNDLVGCDGNSASYREVNYRLQLSFVPL